jgi:N-acetylmuramoyl-L-alanine amidase
MLSRFSAFFACLICCSSLVAAAEPGLVALGPLGKKYGFPSPTRSKTTLTFTSKYSTLVFTDRSRKLIFNGTLIWMNSGTTRKGKAWMISQADAGAVIDPLLRPDNAWPAREIKTIVLDPGHGGKAIGAISKRNVHEKKAVLDIAKRTRDKLSGTGVTVRLTRDTDVPLALATRVSRAKKWNADIFVSIHLNFAKNTAAEGIETFITPCRNYPSTSSNKVDSKDRKHWNNNSHDKANTVLAHRIHDSILKRTGAADRGIKRGRFVVTQNTECPAILVECGFLSNTKEEAKIIQSEYRDKIAQGIADGILACMGPTQ